MTTRYDITVGEVDEARIARTASAFFQGATIRSGIGLWQGETEHSVTVTVIGNHLYNIVTAFARECARLYDQDCVLVESHQVTALLVSGDDTPAREVI